MRHFIAPVGPGFDLSKLMIFRSAVLAALISLPCIGFGHRGAVKQPLCEALTLAEATKVLEEANKTSGIYCDIYCVSNVMRLYEFIKSKHSHLEPKDFRVIYIARPGVVDTRGWIQDQLTFYMRSRSSTWEDGQPREWIRHVVLEHNQVIYDLDESKNPKPMLAHDYFRHMIPDEFDPRRSDWWTKKVHAFIFPGEEILSLPIATVVHPEFQVKVLNFNDGIPLAEVAEALKPK